MTDRVGHIEPELLGTEVSGLLWQARSKSVAHYDVVIEGSDWKL